MRALVTLVALILMATAQSCGRVCFGSSTSPIQFSQGQREASHRWKRFCGLDQHETLHVDSSVQKDEQ